MLSICCVPDCSALCFHVHEVDLWLLESKLSVKSLSCDLINSLTRNIKTAVFCAIVACTKRELKAAIISVTGGRPIYWQEQFKTLKKISIVLVFQWTNTLQVFPVLSCQSTNTSRAPWQTNLFSQKSRDYAYYCDFANQSWTRCNTSLCCAIDARVSFRVCGIY